MYGGKFERKLSEVNTRAVSRRHNELVGKFKMAASDMVSIRGQILEYTYIPTGIKRELIRSSVDCDWKSGLFVEDQWTFIIVDRLFLVSPT
jgi:hypothetical protein